MLCLTEPLKLLDNLHPTWQVSKHQESLRRWFKAVTLHPEFVSVLNLSELKFAGNGKAKKGRSPTTAALEVAPLKVLKLS